MTVRQLSIIATWVCFISLCSSPTRAVEPPALAEEIERLQQWRAVLVGAQRFAEALDTGRELLRACEQHFGPDHWRSRWLRLAIRENERVVRLSPGQLEALFRLKSLIDQENSTGISYHSVDGLRLLREHTQALIGDGPTYVHITGALLIGHLQRNETAKAEELARELTLAGKSIGESSPDYAYGIAHLGFVLACRGELGEAAELLRKGTELNLSHHGAGTSTFLDSVNRLAFLKLRQGKTIEALLLSGAAVSGSRFQKTDDCKDPLALFTWGMANAAIRCEKEARNALGRFVELSKGYIVPDHPLILEAAAQLKRLEQPSDVESFEKEVDDLLQEAARLFSEQRYPQLVEASRALLRAYEDRYGPDHFRCQWLRASIRENERIATLSEKERTRFFELHSRIENELKNGVSYQSTERWTKDREQLKDLIGDDGLYHQLTGVLIVSLYHANNLPRAEQVARELTMAGKSIGESSPELGDAFARLGFLLACQGQLKEADELLTKSVAISYLHREAQEFPFLHSIDGLAYLRLRQGATFEALVISGAAVSGYKRAMNTEECEVATALFTWGMANLALQQKDEARKALERFSELAKGSA